MASKGAYVAGTDGTDFAHRQRVVSIHQQSAVSKYYLKMTFYLHFLLNLLILLKLSEDILDRMDIFILELQELEIPKPDLWEWLYGISIIFTIFAARSIRINSSKLMKFYLFGIITTTIIPIIMAQFQYFWDFYLFVQERNLLKLKYVWHDLPIAVIFEAFAIIGLQVHLFQLYYAYKLYQIFNPYSRRRQQQQQPSSLTANSSSSSNTTNAAATAAANTTNSSNVVNSNNEQTKKKI